MALKAPRYGDLSALANGPARWSSTSDGVHGTTEFRNRHIDPEFLVDNQYFVVLELHRLHIKGGRSSPAVLTRRRGVARSWCPQRGGAGAGADRPRVPALQRQAHTLHSAALAGLRGGPLRGYERLGSVTRTARARRGGRGPGPRGGAVRAAAFRCPKFALQRRAGTRRHDNCRGSAAAHTPPAGRARPIDHAASE
ncbi:hypothetical protein EVAR_103409_1 [Eumeta japonica]|uniref:Uncharacterized protein n=1 Tax=Eumeta variegata TaxID=151549 RepID=A0A4C1YRG8_EUMVA|nr:hypothetical protein EVAR_103409_1 [Eumeta japonica]